MTDGAGWTGWLLGRLGHALLLWALSVTVQAQSLHLLDATPPALFAGRPSPYEIHVSGTPDTSLTLRWELSAKGRILDRGNAVFRLDGRGHSSVRLPIETPPLKRGFRLGASLAIVLVDDTPDASPERFQQDLMLYGSSPLAMRADHYRRMGIKLIDPVGETTAMLNS